MTTNRDRPRVAPVEPYNGIIVCLPVEAVPFALAGLRIKSRRSSWISTDDHKTGRRLLANTGMNMLLECGKEIVNAVNRLYMLTDRNFNGTVYTYEIDDVTGDVLPSPPIPPVPTNPDIYSNPGERWKMDDTHDMLRNAITGIPTADYVEVDATNPLLIQIRDALAAETNEETVALLQKIALALGAAL